MAEPFATPQELSVYSQGAIPESDPRSAGALQAATDIIRGICGWHIAPLHTDEVVTLDGYGQTLSLPTLHVTAVSEVTVDGDVTASDTYQWSTLGELRRDDQWWSVGYRNVSVKMTHGYTDVPAALKQLALAMASRSLTAPAGGVVREQTLASSVTWAQTAPGVSGGVVLMAHEEAVLTPYRIVTA